MSRPNFPNPYTVLTPEIIRRINSDQESYDKDPERWERREREAEENNQREQEEQRQQYEQNLNEQ